MPHALYICTGKGSKFSRDALQSDDAIEIVSSDGSESSEEEGEEELGAGLKETAKKEDGEASSDMQLSDQETGERVQRSNGTGWDQVGQRTLPHCLSQKFY